MRYFFNILRFFSNKSYVMEKIHSMTSLHCDAIGFLFQFNLAESFDHFLSIEKNLKKQLASSSSYYEKMWSWFHLHVCDDQVTTFAVGGDVRVKQQYTRRFLL